MSGEVFRQLCSKPDLPEKKEFHSSDSPIPNLAGAHETTPMLLPAQQREEEEDWQGERPGHKAQHSTEQLFCQIIASVAAFVTVQRCQSLRESQGVESSLTPTNAAGIKNSPCLNSVNGLPTITHETCKGSGT